MPKAKQVVVTPTQTDEINLQILSALKEIKEALNKPISIQALPNDPKPSLERSLPNEQAKAPEQRPSYPVPQNFRDAVDSLLNKSFGLEIEGHVDAPLVTVTIVVPDKYSTASAAQKEVIGGRDIRPKVMTTNGGVPELKEWLGVVYSSFTPEIQAMIVADRK